MQKRPLCLRFKRTVADDDMVSVLRFTEAEERGLRAIRLIRPEEKASYMLNHVDTYIYIYVPPHGATPF